MNSPTYILGIESSCDETSAAVVKDGRYCLSDIISSQIATHQVYGGVVPEIASRKHIENISAVVDAALTEAGVTLADMDAVAVTCGPGLVGALLVGVSYAKSLAYAAGKPLIGVHHIEGHICSNFIEDENLTPPFVALVVSGGHTNLVCMTDYGEFEIMGQTRDDAAGEAYDKVARAIGLGYPGGPKVDQLAKEGKANIPFPRVFLEDDSLDFSFSGLKSAVLNYINKCNMTGVEVVAADVAASFQQAVVDVLVEKTRRACEIKQAKKLVMAGGVSGNSGLRAAMINMCGANDISLTVPRLELCTDNAAMIASAGYFEFCKGNQHDLALNGYPSIVLGDKIV